MGYSPYDISHLDFDKDKITQMAGFVQRKKKKKELQEDRFIKEL